MEAEKGDETYPLKQITKDEEGDTNEKSPLQDGHDGTEKLMEKANGKEEQLENGSKRSPFSSYLSNRNAKIAIVTIIVLISIAFVILVAFLASKLNYDDEWMEDSVPRMLKIVPKPNGPKNMIKFRRGDNSTSWTPFVEEMDAFLKKYDLQTLTDEGKNVTVCSSDKLPEDNQVCHYNIDRVLNNCKPKDKFGYPDGTPCIFLVINQILNWAPEKYTSTDLEDPSIPPPIISKLKSGNRNLLLHCDGNNNFDKEVMGKISYYPSEEIPNIFFPYKGHPDYLSPFIALKFESLTPSVIVNIKCQLWAKNINPSMEANDEQPSPMIPFHILME